MEPGCVVNMPRPIYLAVPGALRPANPLRRRAVLTVILIALAATGALEQLRSFTNVIDLTLRPNAKSPEAAGHEFSLVRTAALRI